MTRRSKLCLPGSRYCATDIGLIMTQGVYARMALPALENSRRKAIRGCCKPV